MGAGIEMVRKIIRDDPEALSLFDAATVGKPGRPSKSNRDIITNSTEPERGTSRQYALRRLRKDRPDLHELRDRALAMEHYLRRHGGSLEAGAHALDIRLRAEFEMGGLLDAEPDIDPAKGRAEVSHRMTLHWPDRTARTTAA